MERLQGEMDNPDTRRLIQETVERSTGIAYTISLILDDENSRGNASSGHLVRAARAIGAQIIEEVELKENADE